MQAREDLIERTFESVRGAKNAIIHLYNSTSPAQRRVVFGKSKEEIVEIAVHGAQLIKDLCGGSRAPMAAPVFAGEFHRDGSRIRQGNFRGGDGRLAADAAKAR